MRGKLWNVLRSVGSIILGYAVIVLGTSIGFKYVASSEYYGVSPFEKMLAAGVAVFSGLAGGYVAGWISPSRPVLHAAGVILFLIMDTTYVVTSGISKSPVWFDLMGAATLMVTSVVGGLLYQKTSLRPQVNIRKI